MAVYRRGAHLMAQSTATQTKRELLAAERKHYAPINWGKVTISEELVDNGVNIRLTPKYDGHPGKTPAVTVRATA